MTPRHRRLSGVLVGIALLFPIVTAPGSFADPIADKRAEAAQIAQQLERQGEKVSILAEQSNRAQIKVSEVEGSLAKTQADVAQSDQRLQETRARLASAAVLAYVHGGSNSLIGKLARSSQDDLIVRSQYLRVAAADERQVIGEVRLAKQDFQLLQSHLEADRKAAAAAAADAAAASRAAAQAEDAQRAVLSKVNGELGDLVAADQARKEAEALAARPAPAVLTAVPAVTLAPGVTEPPRVPTSAAPQAAAQTATTVAPKAAAVPVSGKGAAAVAEARKQLGKPYVYGGAGPDSYDCSGLTSWAWRAAGVSLSHSAYDQWFETTRVSVDAVVPGDLLFFGDDGVESIHHVTLYIGDGQMIEASTTGTPVRIRGWRSVDLVGAGRPG